MVPSLLLSSKDVPAGATTFTVKLPSLNGGKNSVPKKGTMLMAAIIKAMAMPITNLVLFNPQSNNLRSCFFNQRTKLLSCSCAASTTSPLISPPALSLLRFAANDGDGAFFFFQNARLICFK